MNRLIMWIMAVCALLGGIDRIFGNKTGLGKKFEEGFLLMGSTALSMAGIICLVPLMAGMLRSRADALCAPFGLDPSLFGGLLAIDMGGYPLACELAASPQAANFSGVIVAAIIGCTITFTIPVGMGMLNRESRADFSRGILFGLCATPIALMIGGMMCGLNIKQTLLQCLPFILFSLILFICIWKKPSLMICIFSGFAKCISAATTIGLMLASFEYMTGTAIFPGLAPISDAMEVVASIAVVMLGSLPFSHLLCLALKKPMDAFGRKAGMNSAGIAGLLIGMVSALPAIALVKDMDRRSRIVNAAFLVCAASAFAAHLGFVAGTDASMLAPLLVSKLTGGIAGAAIALLATRNLKA